MADKMLVTQALDERDLLVKKIQDKISKASFVDTIKPNEEKVLDARVSKEEFAKDAESAYQQIQDLIERFQKIDAAIVASNANTTINTTYGSFTASAFFCTDCHSFCRSGMGNDISSTGQPR